MSEQPSYEIQGQTVTIPAVVRGGEGDQTRPGGEGVELELGSHPLADELRTLGLDSATPILSAWSEHMRGSFGRCEKL